MRGRKLSYGIREPVNPHAWEVKKWGGRGGEHLEPGTKNGLQNHWLFKTMDITSWTPLQPLVSAVF